MATSLLDHLLLTAADVPPAVVNAVCDALDVDHVDMPLTPETVWHALRRAGPPVPVAQPPNAAL